MKKIFSVLTFACLLTSCTIVSGEEYNRWSPSETQLPEGIVMGTGQDSTASTNWISVRKPDGQTILVKNIDKTLFQAINIHDTIQ